MDVGGACGYRLVETCSIGSHENVSNTQTAALLPQATNSRLPSLESGIAFGCSPVGSSSIGSSESAVNPITRAPPHSETYTVLPSGETTHVYGSAGSGTVFVTCPVVRSMADSVIANTRVTKSVRPSLLMATPPAKVSPVCPGSASVRAFVRTPSAYANSCTLFWPPPPTYTFVPSGLKTRPYQALSSV